ncbi:HlyD family efflux transporter periplasmic adaptor subunit, partial [Rhizobium johnstonii]|uniref:HlyD family efflux transporter periplasmic adaptor subunit n=1 Tax=Rhizobium johnstonii TaxID=3019933 RepID=UPI003F9DD24B
ETVPATGVFTSVRASFKSASAIWLFTIIRDGDIELVAEVAESDVVRIMAGQKATISLSGSRDKLSGAVRLVSPTVDPVTRLGLVHISIDDD